MLVDHAPARRARHLRDLARAINVATTKPKLIDRVIRAVKPTRGPEMKGKWW